MDKKEWLRFLNLTLDVGENMLICGGEIRRVEDTIRRICTAYGAKRCDVFSVISFITVTVTTDNDDTCTVTRRVTDYDIDLFALEKINAFSRQICSDPKPPDEMALMLKDVLTKRKNKLYAVIGNMIACGAFTVFFGGAATDAIAAMIVAFIITISTDFLKKITINELVYTVIGCFVAGMSALLLTALGLGVHSDKIMIGSVMLFVPGIELATSIRDLLWGDVMSGTLKLIKSLLLAAAIVFGFAIAILITGGIR